MKQTKAAINFPPYFPYSTPPHRPHFHQFFHLHLALHNIPAQRLQDLKCCIQYHHLPRHVTKIHMTFLCSACVLDKQAEAPHRPIKLRSYAVVEAISVDKLGAIPSLTSRKTTMLTVLDAGSRFLISIVKIDDITTQMIVLHICTTKSHFYKKKKHLFSQRDKYDDKLYDT